MAADPRDDQAAATARAIRLADTSHQLRTIYQAHIAAGFNPDQALVLTNTAYAVALQK
ncbi:MAG: hypothetical protein ABI112_17950 [Terracoccus sp.]